MTSVGRTFSGSELAGVAVPELMDQTNGSAHHPLDKFSITSAKTEGADVTKGRNMADKRKSNAALVVDLSILRLAATAIDVRGSLAPRDITRVPSLQGAFDALDKVLSELGWNTPESMGEEQLFRSKNLESGAADRPAYDQRRTT